jgi:ABC-type long-subunit fatty acid transport system fused permease/ATPase subunit
MERIGVSRHFIKWALMLLVLFWMVVFRLSESVDQLPEFVYVNF